MPAAKNLTNTGSALIRLSRRCTHFGNASRLAVVLFAACSFGQTTPQGPAAKLYSDLSNVGLDQKQVYNVRGAALDREDMHIAIDDGAIAFTESVNGRITGALFEGEGTVLIVPPNQVERHSLGMFTDSAVLNQSFTKAYFRFDDSHFVSDLQPYLRPLDSPSEFIDKENSLAKNLAALDALRLMVSLTRTASKANGPLTGEFIHAHFVGPKGTFDASWDTGVTEQIAAGQSSLTDHGAFYDQWMLFPMRSVRQRDTERHNKGLSNDQFYEDEFPIIDYKIRTQIKPPTELSAEATLDLVAKKSGDRTLLFELSRFLKLSSVTMDVGSNAVPLEFIQNQAIEGTQLAKRGNDVTAVVFPQPLTKDQHMRLHFKYSGDVLSDAGGGLLYVGERGTWYPNRGPTMSDFDLEFSAPVEWMLLATGKLQSRATSGGVEISRWRSERAIPFAGFNLGKYTVASAKSALSPTEISAYAAGGVEKAFPVTQPPPEVVIKEKGRPPVTIAAPALPLTTAMNAGSVAEKARDTIDFLVPRLGAFPYSSLLLTQIPGPDSQGWPGLVYLSGHVFLTPQQRAQGHDADYAKSAEELIYNHLMEAHETAHQWWGDAVLWQSYRDQWLMEAMANYCALLEIESHSPEEAKALLEFYRKRLLTPSADATKPRKDAGPVTFGLRLNSAPFPGAYEPVAYGRGTWLIHMLREMLRDARRTSRPGGTGNASADEPDALFYSVLRNIQKKYSGKIMSTEDFQTAFEEVWPESLRYEGKKSLDWFFDGWVNGTAIPKYELSNVKFSHVAGKTTVRATMLQKDSPDSLVTAVPIYAQTAGALVFIDRVFADGNESDIKLTVPTGTKKLVVDPYETVLREK